MKKITVTIISLIFLLNIEKTFANLWIGKGYAITYPNTDKEVKRNCTEIVIDFDMSKNKLIWNMGQYICMDLQAKYGQETFDLKDGNIFSQNMIIGNYTEKEINLNIFDPSDNTTFQLKLKTLPNGILNYSEKWFDMQKNILFTVDGNLISK